MDWNRVVGLLTESPSKLQEQAIDPLTDTARHTSGKDAFYILK